MTWSDRTQPIEVSDGVAHLQQWFRNNAQYACDTPHAGGQVTALVLVGKGRMVAEIEEYTIDLPIRVDVRHLSTAKRIILGHRRPDRDGMSVRTGVLCSVEPEAACINRRRVLKRNVCLVNDRVGPEAKVDGQAEPIARAQFPDLASRRTDGRAIREDSQLRLGL
jgi:hypothetical protein